MAELTTNQRYHLLLGDVAMAMAISTQDAGYRHVDEPSGYAPGHLRDRWLAGTTDDELRRRVCAMANAGMGALQRMQAEDLCTQARRFGVPLDDALASTVAEHFEQRRSAVLRYRR